MVEFMTQVSNFVLHQLVLPECTKEVTNTVLQT